MVSFSISLPERLKAYVDGKVATSAFRDASDYFAALIREEARSSARAELDGLLLEGIRSEETPWSETALDEIREEARAPR